LGNRNRIGRRGAVSHYTGCICAASSGRFFPGEASGSEAGDCVPSIRV
jgi:hypothetical protein